MASIAASVWAVSLFPERGEVTYFAALLDSSSGMRRGGGRMVVIDQEQLVLPPWSGSCRLEIEHREPRLSLRHIVFRRLRDLQCDC